LAGIFPANQNIQGGQRAIGFQIGLFRYVEETHIFSKENHL
jgi:hypothetical protein